MMPAVVAVIALAADAAHLTLATWDSHWEMGQRETFLVPGFLTATAQTRS